MLSRSALSLALLLAACGSPAATPDAPASAWSTVAMPLPAPRLEPGVATLGTQLVVIGGFDTSLAAGLDITKKIDVLDTSLRVWNTTMIPDAPVAWTHIQAAGIDSTLYVLGGLEGQSYTARGDAYAIDTQATTPAWRALAAMPAGMERGSAAVVVAPPRIYLLGGSSTTSALASCVYYDLLANTWGQLPDLPQPRSHPVAMRRVDGSLIVAGGLATLDSSSQTSDVWMLLPGGTQWQARAAMPTARGGCAAGVVQGQLICAGGEAGTSALPTVESYDPIGDVWTVKEMMPEPRAGTQGAAIGLQLFVPGGARHLQFDPTDTVYVYSPLDTPAP